MSKICKIKNLLFKTTLISITAIQMLGISAFAEGRIIPHTAVQQNERISPFDDILNYTYPQYGNKDSYSGLLQAGTALPEKFDPRNGTKAIEGWPIQNQGNEGNCWAFAATAAREAWENKQNPSNGYPKYSEYHMAASMYHNTSENKYTYKIENGKGGNREMATAYYSRGSGPTLLSVFDKEKYDAYYTKTASLKTYNDEVRGIKSAKQVQNALFITDTGAYDIEILNVRTSDNTISKVRYPSRFSEKNIDVIKQAVLDYGAVMTGYCSTEGELTVDYFNKDKSSYCYCPNLSEATKNVAGGTTGVISNHAVTIVGWDDSYSWSNFKKLPSGIDGLPESKANMNGAWIVRNSWGDNSSFKVEGGYEYISYYDFLIGGSAAVFPGTIEKTDYINQYDGLYPNNIYAFSSNTISVKNRFDTESNGNECEVLEGIGVFVPATDTTVGVRIDSNITENDTNEDAYTVRVKGKTEVKNVSSVNSNSVKFDYPGFYIIELAEDVNVSGKYEVILDFDSGDATQLTWVDKDTWEIYKDYNENWSKVPLETKTENENGEEVEYVYVHAPVVSVAVLANNANSFSSESVAEESASYIYNGVEWASPEDAHIPIKTYTNTESETSVSVNVECGEDKNSLNAKIFYSREDREICDGKTAVLAVYNKSNGLCDVKTEMIDLNGGSTQEISMDYAEGYKYKFMVIDGFGSMIPIIDSENGLIPQQ